jgi:putative nucleotidyltransferase with HDIG domain
LNRLQSEPAWDSVLAIEPAPVRFITGDEFDGVARRVADFVDMRSPFTVGHSSAVASLSASAALELGLPITDQTLLRHAGLLHDLGRCGVPASFWNKPEQLLQTEWERMKGHPSLTELVLARSNALGHLGTLAGLHHEHLDGSGYRGIAAASLPLTARILATADTYQTKLELRPYRPALSPIRAAEALNERVGDGKFDGDVVSAVLAATGHRRERAPAPSPAGLSEREVEVLRLAVQGLTNRQIADLLVLSPKTVGHHIENIYSKIGVSTRVGATLFALNHGLIHAD